MNWHPARRSGLSTTWFAVGFLVSLVGPPGSRVVGADNPPEVVRVRLPAARVSTYFPAGTPLRTLAVEPFEALVAAAIDQAAARTDRSNPPRRPIRVDHEVEWNDGVLGGQSRVTLPATGAAAAVVVLDPWSPSLVASAEREAIARVDRSGRLVLIQPEHQPARVVALPWRQAALPDSRGQSVALRLPDADVAVLRLDLPAEVVPSANAAAPGSRRGPDPGAGPDRSRWEFAGASGWFPVQLAATGRAGDEIARPGDRLWVGGATRIDLNAAAANWVAEWQVETTAGSPPACVIELDPGLELLDVVGPEVERFHLEPVDRPGGSRRVSVRFHDHETNRSRRTTITLRGRVQVPLDGPWLVPAGRPVNARWLGGTTEVRLDPTRRLVAVEERAGRRVAAEPTAATPTATLRFESDGRPGPVAELRFEAARVDAAVAIAGTLRLGSFAPRAEVTATWTTDRGGWFAPTLDFPAGWLVDRVASPDGRPSANWHAEALPGGGTRVHVADLAPGRTAALVVAATWVETGAGSPGHLLPLPRVRPRSPAAVRVADERWVAEVAAGWEVEPTATHGLAWLDPASSLPAATGGGDEPLEAGAAPLPTGPRLAWRWWDDAGSGSLRCRPVEPRCLVEDRLEAAVVAGRLRLDWSWTIAASGRPAGLPFHLDLAGGDVVRWRLADRSGGQVIAARPLDPARRAGLGWPADGVAAELDLTNLPPGPLTLRGEAELAWAGAGSIPLARFGPSVRTARSVVVRVEDATRVRVDQADGLIAVGSPWSTDPGVDGSVADLAPLRAISGEDEVGMRVAGAWVGDDPAPGLLRMSTRPASAAPSARSDQGVVTEASLSSRLAPGTAARHRLILRIAPGAARTIDLKLPAGGELDRIRRDGLPIVAARVEEAFRVDLVPGDSTRPTSTIILDYRTPAVPAGTAPRVHPSVILPALTLPCLGFNWRVNVPERYAVSSGSPDLMATDPADPPGWAWDGTETTNPEPDAAAQGAMLADLDATLATAPPTETTLGEWLVKLDAGRWPVVVDRLALASLGWGPRSRINVAGSAASPPRDARATFHALGLAVEPIGATYLVSTEADQRQTHPAPGATAPEHRALGTSLLAAATTGSDEADRYQTPARWRGEPTPRPWLASETPDRGLVAAGWRTHRFTAARWPAAATAIQLTDTTTFWRHAALVVCGFAAAGCLLWASRVPARRLGRRVGVGVGVAAGLAVTCSASARVDVSPAAPILALWPYDDLAAITAPPPRVILRAEDHDRLIRLAHSRPPTAEAQARLIRVTHHVAPPSGRTVVVATRSTLEVVGPGAASWSWPVGSSHDLTATIDGQPTPLAISPDGRTATLPALGAGRFAVTFQRSVPFQGESGSPGVGSIQVEVERAAFAEVEVERGDWTGPITWPDRGSRAPGASGGLVADDLGPTSVLDVRWGPPPTPERPELAATILWDAQPAGDRVVARLAVVGTQPIRSLRLALEPGVAVVGEVIPGLVGTQLDGTADRPEWVAHVDPPLGPGATCAVSLWRAAASSGTARSLPRWSLLGGRMSGVVGYRQAAPGTARLTVDPPLDDAAPLSAAEFVRLWGPLPPDGLALAGVARWTSDRAMIAQAVAEPTERVARDQVGVEVIPGGCRFVVDSVLSDTGAANWEAEASFDAPVRVDRVEASGLASWTLANGTRLRLVFEGSQPPGERAIRLLGSVALAAPADDEARNPFAEAIVPWPRWTGVARQSASLVVVGGEAVQVRAGEQRLAPNPVEASPVPPAQPLRHTYTLGRAMGNVRLAWLTPAPHVRVAVESHLALEPDRAVWTAQVISEVTAGSTATLSWQLPTAWASAATLAAPDGTTPRVAAETREDATIWTITLDRPIWDRQTLTLRSARPLGPGMTLTYPEVAPLARPGRGSVATYDLAVTNLAGTSLTVTDATGLTAVPPGGWRSDLSPVPGGVVSQAFRVAAERWSLGLRVDPTAPAGSVGSVGPVGRWDGDRRLAHLERVDFRVGIDSAGRSQGQAECRVDPGAAFLAVTLDAGARWLGATVAGRAVLPVETAAEAAGRWLIPLGDGSARRVAFAWVGGDPLREDTARGMTVPMPRFDQAAVPTAIGAWSTATATELAVAGGDWRRVGALEAALRRFERDGEEIRIAASRGQLDLAAPVAARLLDRLTAFALDLRQAERALRAEGAGAQPRPRLDAWLAVEAQVNRAVTEAGGGDLLVQARERVGLAPPGPEATEGSSFEGTVDVYRVRPLGTAAHFVGVTPRQADQPFGLTLRLRHLTP